MAKVTFKGGFEPKVQAMLKAHKIKHKYEPDTIDYTVVKHRKYIPDFKITTPSGKEFYLECKGWFRPEDREKMKYVRLSNPDADIRILFASDSKLKATAKMTYSDWCKKYGYRYAIGSLPKEWLL